MVIAPLVIDLGILAMFVVGLALCLLAKQIVKGLFQLADSALGWIPWVGSKFTGSLTSIEQRLTNKIGDGVVGLEHRIGSLWHATAGLVAETGDKIADAFHLIYDLAQHVASLPGREVVTKVHEVEHTTVITKRVAGHAVKAAEHAVARAVAIPADVVLPRDLAGLRGRVRVTEEEIARLWRRVRGFAVPAAVGVGVGTVAWAIGKLGMTWARCSNVNKVGRRLCGMDHDALEALLAGTLAIVGTVSLVEFIRDAQAVEEVALDALGAFIREMPRA